MLRKISHSESALDDSFQLALQNEEGEMDLQDQDQVSTDSSIPSMDERSERKTKKKRFHFPSFVKRSKNKTLKDHEL